jgi:hypothetical protein
VKLAAEIILTAVPVLTLVVFGVMFVWAARKDGEEEQAVRRRLGLRR